MEDMQGLFDYIDEYANFSFEEKPLGAVDSLIFSQLVYTDFGGIAEGSKKIFLCDAAMKFFAKHTDDEIEELIGISVKSAKLLMACAKTRRFGWVQLCNYVNNVNDEIDKQFAGINFILDSDNLMVAFRGTDVTVTGVKESAMLSYMFPVPAQIEALHYFQETAMLAKGDIYICGHSKGGNLAVFAAVNCSNSLKKRIAGVYEYDAPGFPKWFFDRYDYAQIKDKIFLITPQTSIIGRMLYHNAKPIIVESIFSGIKQHQVSSWVIDKDSFKVLDKYDYSSDIIAEYVNTLIDYVGDDDLELFFDTIEYVLTKMGIDDFYDFKSVDVKKAIGLIDSLATLDDNQKERFKAILKKVFSDFTREYFSGKARDYSERAKDYLEKFKMELPGKKEQE
ncbi:MAG: Mbeg1-like protein [Eubacterium sp.]